MIINPARYIDSMSINTPFTLPGTRESEGQKVMKRFTAKRLVALSGIAAAAVIAASALALTTPAMAATAAPASPAATTNMVSALPQGYSTTTTTTGHLTTRQVAANEYCSQTPVDAVHGAYFGIEVWWITMQTIWCYDGSHVLSHSTVVQHWQSGGNYHYNGSYVFTCPNGCTENSENINGDPTFYFQGGGVVYAWNVHLWQNEFYNGTWNAGWNAYGYAA